MNAQPATDEAGIRFPKLLKVEQVCKILTLSAPSVYRLLESGEIPYVKMGRTRRIKEEDVRAYLEKNTVKRA